MKRIKEKIARLEDELGVLLKLIEESEDEWERNVLDLLAHSHEKKINKLREKFKE